MSNPVMQLTHIQRTYGEGDAAIRVLRDVNLTILPGQTIALIGPSGSGKSTLLQIAGLLDTPNGGEITINGEAATGASDNTRTLLRRKHIGFVYQFHHLMPEFSALENVMLPLLMAGQAKKAAQGRAEKLLADMQLSARLHHRPAKLSGGEQQRVAIARALAPDPALLLADEPTGNLDTHTAEDVFAILIKRCREEGKALLMATHNPDLAQRMDKVITLKDGILI